jgi:hypothetical protein
MRGAICRSILLLACLCFASGQPVRLVPCQPLTDGTNSGWELRPVGAKMAISMGSLCLSLSAAPGVLEMAKCDGTAASQLWVQEAADAGALRLKSFDGRCLRVSGSDYSFGPGVLLGPCERPEPYSIEPRFAERLGWEYSAETPRNASQLRTTAIGCCGDIFSKLRLCLAVDKYPTCIDAPLSGFPFCNKDLPAAERARDLVSRMTLDEKAANMDSYNPGVPRLGLTPNTFGEALHAVNSGCGASHDFGTYKSTGCATVFPQVITLGATWNRSLWTAVGAAISTEVRALYNQNVGWHAGLFLWTPNINPFRGDVAVHCTEYPTYSAPLHSLDPRWGRGQEVPSEVGMAL